MRSVEQFFQAVKAERSDQFFVTECFYNLFLEVSDVSLIKIIIIQVGKNIGIQKHAGKVRKTMSTFSQTLLFLNIYPRLLRT